MGDSAKTLAEIRSDVCNTSLVVTWYASLPALATSLVRIVDQGWLPVMGLHLAAVALLSFVTLARHRIAFNVRAGTLIGLMFTVGSAGVLNMAMMTGVVSFLVGAGILAACLFGTRLALVVIAAAAVVLIAAFLGFRSGILLPPDFAVAAFSPTTWIVAVFTFATACAGPCIAVARFTRDLEHERLRAESASAAKSEFLAVMSHELRTPLTGVLGVADLLRRESLSAKQSDWVSRLTQSAQELLALISDILDFSKIEAGQLVIEQETFDLSGVVAAARGTLEPVAARKDLALVWQTDEMPAYRVVSDSTRIRQILVNLVGNALKFTARGRVEVTLRRVARADGVDLTIEVMDTGIGMTPDVMARIFEPFIQGDSGIARRFGGTGLGLAICRRLLESMGGHISVVSSPGEGSTFTAVIPIVETDVPTARSADTSVASPRALRLLVAEDVETTRQIIVAMLTRMGHHVVGVENGQLALEAVQQSHFDLVVMDMQMPVMDGERATRAIRALGGFFATLPIIAVTAEGLRERYELFQMAGVNTVLPKPIDWSKLNAEIARYTATQTDAAVAATVQADAAAALDINMVEALTSAIGAAPFARLLETFGVDLIAYAARLEEEAISGDLVKIKRTAHALKGLSGQFGAARLSALANDIERQDRIEAVCDQVPRLKSEIESAIAAAKRYAQTLKTQQDAALAG